VAAQHLEEFAMEMTRPTPSKATRTAPPVIQPEQSHAEPRTEVRTEIRAGLRNVARSSSGQERNLLAYGLPCANCHLYYPAGFDACPVCNCRDRVSANVAPIIRRSQASAEPQADASVLDQEREAFLKQFKSQLVEADTEAARTSAVCALGDHDNPEAATVCKPCYDLLQERVDVLEAALHIDLKEAAQIVYDAVWADPSDPSKTYANAASALLAELRKRSGVSGLLGPFQPLGN
jgi:hypothetical protein